MLHSKFWDGCLRGEGHASSTVLELVFWMIQDWRVSHPVQLMHVLDDAGDAMEGFFNHEPALQKRPLPTKHFAPELCWLPALNPPAELDPAGNPDEFTNYKKTVDKRCVTHQQWIRLYGKDVAERCQAIPLPAEFATIGDFAARIPGLRRCASSTCAWGCASGRAARWGWSSRPGVPWSTCKRQIRSGGLTRSIPAAGQSLSQRTKDTSHDSCGGSLHG